MIFWKLWLSSIMSLNNTWEIICCIWNDLLHSFCLWIFSFVSARGQKKTNCIYQRLKATFHLKKIKLVRVLDCWLHQSLFNSEAGSIRACFLLCIEDIFWSKLRLFVDLSSNHFLSLQTFPMLFLSTKMLSYAQSLMYQHQNLTFMS